LNSIINYLEIVLEEPLENHAREYLEKSLAASKSLVYAVNDLLNLTTMEDALFEMHEEDFDLRAVISEVLATFQHHADRNGLTLSFKPEDPRIPRMVRGDPGRLRQIISNLLSNAAESSSHGSIFVELGLLEMIENKPVVEIVVQDTGVGMSEDELDGLFQEFEQILEECEDDPEPFSPASSTMNHLGRLPLKRRRLGLGLAVVARHVRIRNGQIKVRSEKGKGTRVSIELPFRQAYLKAPRPLHELQSGSITSSDFEPGTAHVRIGAESTSKDLYINGFSAPSPTSAIRQADIMETPDVLPSNSCSTGLAGTNGTVDVTSHPFPKVGGSSATGSQSKLSILVAEDNPLNSKVLDKRLRKMGHSVTLVSDGQDCAETFRGRPDSFDIILMDLQAHKNPLNPSSALFC
jgi:CheY-like chemotaxis protein